MGKNLSLRPGLTGRVAVVTGGSRGIGAATCRALAAYGARVAVNGRDRTAVEALVGDITANGGEAVGVVGDVTDEQALERIRAEIESALGPVQVVVAFAGGGGAPTPTVDLGAGRWRAVLDSDLTSLYLTVTEFLPGMVERGAGSIITMSSSAGRQPGAANIAYAVAKAGVIMFTRHLAKEVGSSGVRVNCLAPSAIRNEKMDLMMSAEQLAGLAATFPLGRIGLPADVADAAVFFASDESSWITGATLDISGGRVTG